MAQVDKIDSNVTGLRYAEEDSYGTLPATPDWIPLEPNSYADFGGEITTIARNPINPSRQRKKGVVTDLDSSGGFSTDLTQENLQDILQGFFFADLRDKDDIDSTDAATATDEFTVVAEAESAVVAAGGSTYVEGDILTLSGGTSTVAATVEVTGVTGGAVDTVEVVEPGAYTVIPTNPVSTTGGSGTGCTLTVTWNGGEDYVADDLIFAKDFDDAANNGLHLVTGTPDENTIGVTTNLVDATSQSGKISRVGFEFDTGDAAIDMTGTLPALDTTTKDMTDFGLVPGEWVFIGGDAAANQFATAANNGFARIRSVTANVMTFDKTADTMVTDAGTGKDIRIFFGRCLKNELGTLVKRRSYNLERQLGAPDDAEPTEIQSEYLTGAIPNEITVNIPTAEKVTMDLTFVGKDFEQRTGAAGVKSGNRPSLAEGDAFNTSSDFSRIKMAIVYDDDAAPSPLFAYLSELTLTVNNNVSPAKAVGVLGAFEATAGTFAVGGSMTAYFADVTAVQAVRNNSDITLDAHMVKANSGISIDLPLVSLGDGRPNVAQDEPITLPLSMEAATAAKIDTSLDHTLLMVFWDYLPDAADV